MEHDPGNGGRPDRGQKLLYLLTLLPLWLLPALPIYAYFFRPDNTKLFTVLLAVEGVLCIAGALLINVRWSGMGGSGKNAKGRYVLTKKSLFDHLNKRKVKTCATLHLVLAAVWCGAALISIRTEDLYPGEFSVTGWIAIGLSAIIVLILLINAIKLLKPAGSFILTLSQVTYTEEVESRDSDGDPSYSYYIHFAKARIPREKTIGVTRGQYYSTLEGDKFYLLVVNGRIAGRFEEELYVPDDALKGVLVDETVPTPGEITEAKAKQDTESKVMKAVIRGKMPELKAGAQNESIFGTRKPTLDEELARPEYRAPDKHSGASSGKSAAALSPRELDEFFVRPRVIRLVVSVLAAGVLLACLLLFLPNNAYMWWRAALLPLLFAARPVKELISFKRDQVQEGRSTHISRRSFVMNHIYKMANSAVQWACVFFAVWWPAHCFVRSEGDPGLWGPLFLFVFPPGIAALILLILIPFTIKKRRKLLKERRVSIVELPLIRKETQELTSTPDYRFWFPDIDRGKSLILVNKTTVVYEDGKLKVYTSRSEYEKASEGDLFTFIFVNGTGRAADAEVCGFFPSKNVVVDDDMAGCMTRFDPSLMREEDKLNYGL